MTIHFRGRSLVATAAATAFAAALLPCATAHADGFCRVQRLEPALDPTYVTQLPLLAATTIGDTQWLAIGALPANPQSPVLLYHRALGDGPDAPWIPEILPTTTWPATAYVIDLSMASNLLAVIAGGVPGISVFRNVDGVWQFEATLANPTPPPYVGIVAVAVGTTVIDGAIVERIVAGIPDGPVTGKVRVHRNDGAGWFVEALLPLPNDNDQDYGRAVATDGHRIVVGMAKSPWPGRVDVFVPSTGMFSLEQSIEQPYAGLDHPFHFGRSLAIGVDSLAVGTAGEFSSLPGQVDFFGRDARTGVWSHVDSINGPLAPALNLGRRLASAVDGDELVVAVSTEADSGPSMPSFVAPKLLRLRAGSIVEQQPLPTTTPWGLQEVGPTVAVVAGSRPTVFVGVPSDRMSPLPRGAIRVYETDGPDCDNDGTADGCVLDGDPALDCDGSGVPDACEIASGVTIDTNNDGIPDSCQPPACGLSQVEAIPIPGGNGQIAADGDTLAVGAPLAGQTFIFERSGGAWRQTSSIPVPVGSSQTFGVRVALRGDVLVVGADLAVWAFVRVDGAWGPGQSISTDQATAIATDGVRIALLGAGKLTILHREGGAWATEAILPNQGFIQSPSLVAIDGDRIASKFGNDDGVRIFRHDATWTVEQLVTVVDAGANGIDSLSLRNDRLIVGHNAIAAPGILGGGASVFTRQGRASPAWTHVQNLDRLDGLPWTNIGTSLAADADWLAIAAAPPTNGAHFGAAWICRWNGDRYVPQRRLAVAPLAAFDGYAKGVALVADGAGSATVFVQAVPTMDDPRVHRFEFKPVDCDGSGFDDECEIALGFAGDVDGDGLPDTCDNPADLDGNGVVNGADLGLLLGNWGGRGIGDINGDGVVDGGDLGLLLGGW